MCGVEFGMSIGISICDDMWNSYFIQWAGLIWNPNLHVLFNSLFFNDQHSYPSQTSISQYSKISSFELYRSQLQSILNALSITIRKSHGGHQS